MQFTCLGVNAQGLKDAFSQNGVVDEVADGAGFDVLQRDPLTMVSTIINTVLGILGIIFLILTIQGGYLWMTAQGDAPKVEKGKTIITRAVIGLAVILSAYTITFFIFSNLNKGGMIETDVLN